MPIQTLDILGVAAFLVILVSLFLGYREGRKIAAMESGKGSAGFYVTDDGGKLVHNKRVLYQVIDDYLNESPEFIKRLQQAIQTASHA